jgi:hypothetical protein
LATGDEPPASPTAVSFDQIIPRVPEQGRLP